MATELVTQDQALVVQTEALRFLPVMSLSTAVERREVIVQAVQKLMKPSAEGEADGDYGVIPGTKKPTLLQPGADKLCNLFGLVPTFAIVEKDADWTGERHAGEPFFFYEIKCQLYRGDFLMGEGVGSANSWETKYRFRKAERECPKCGTAAIIKGKEEYGRGWLCFAKKGGCGAKFGDDDEEILPAGCGIRANPQVFDAVNTIRKIANKRAKVAATLNATSAHEFFTQDVEDMPPPPPQDGNGTKPVNARPDTANRRKPLPGPEDTPEGFSALLWAAMGTNIPKICNTFEHLKRQMEEISGSDTASTRRWTCTV